MEKKSSISLMYARETGLLTVEQQGQVVELCKEDIEEIVEAAGLLKDQLASRKDFQ
jgi:hypothetical protein